MVSKASLTRRGLLDGKLGAGQKGCREKRSRGGKQEAWKKNVPRIYTPFGTKRNQAGTKHLWQALIN